MIILGIDPGLAIVGYGVVEYKNNKFRTIDYGAITTPAGMDTVERLELIYKGMNQLFHMYDIDEVGVEELFFNKNVKTAITVAQARGVILLSCKHHYKPVFEYTPLQIKQGVCGYGRADKYQVQRMVTSFLNLKSVPKPDDVADALAVSICHAHSNRLDKELDRYGL
ncbi:crossover junction endodeoxyribonuclease RuvC [Peptostreptococcus canis]|uniref:Crossover junction endodeoxyribonuclease RuvC n=1 Tax=Peptostreptococcus canis TaxID=1159213 RepID=A0ABR6TKT3_9FIRM|nr:crossover junction endodeoxyribonuclease RuvC [Peptostreptococcus canis]MBC2576020.1 crossover junction endodeoxyribonuclease RuvC [Peptostreptococcus canis]MBP1997856.1 crossover junction endodeoxyribonuclease RuvC [Peptostreptococcus canis]